MERDRSGVAFHFASKKFRNFGPEILVEWIAPTVYSRFTLDLFHRADHTAISTQYWRHVCRDLLRFGVTKLKDEQKTALLYLLDVFVNLHIDFGKFYRQLAPLNDCSIAFVGMLGAKKKKEYIIFPKLRTNSSVIDIIVGKFSPKDFCDDRENTYACNSSSIGREVRPRKFTPEALSSSLTAHKTQTPSYIYMQSTLVAAILFRNEIIYATLPKLNVTSPDDIITLGIQASLSSAPPVG